MNLHGDGAATLIGSGGAVLGIELGSTRIKASLITPDTTPLASGSYGWENQLKDGIWTYAMEDVWTGLAACYVSLRQDVRARYAVELAAVAAMGVSAMMHGYVALDVEGRLLVPFRTWRNNITGRACAELTPLLDFAVPQRWSIAHLYQSILEEQPHVARIAHLTTLAGYVHWKLTGEHAIGVGEASGMFPIDPQTGDWDAARMATFDALIAPRGLAWRLRDILPDVLPAGRPAGRLTAEGAKLLDPSRAARDGHPPVPSRGRRRHRHGRDERRAPAVRERLGGHVDVRDDRAGEEPGPGSRGDRHRGYPRRQARGDGPLRTTGRPTSMPGSPSSGRWPRRWGPRRDPTTSTPGSCRWQHRAIQTRAASLRSTTCRASTLPGFTEGRPLFARNAGQPVHAWRTSCGRCTSRSLCALRTGMDILTEQEGVVIEEIRGHGGFFKGGDTGQRMMAAALDVPVSIPATAGEGGAWGMAVLAAYMLRLDAEQSLPDYLDEHIAASIGRPVPPDPRDVHGFAAYYARHRKGLSIEREAVNALT